MSRSSSPFDPPDPDLNAVIVALEGPSLGLHIKIAQRSDVDCFVVSGRPIAAMCVSKTLELFKCSMSLASLLTLLRGVLIAGRNWICGVAASRMARCWYPLEAQPSAPKRRPWMKCCVD